MKVFKMNDCDWVAAESLEQAKKFALDDPGTEIEDPRELTDADMLRLKHSGDDGVEYDPPITFKEELERNIADGVEFPCIFATSEI